MTETISDDYKFVNSYIEEIKQECHVDFIIDISEGFPNRFPQLHKINFRYKSYYFIVVLSKYNNGTPWTEIYNNAIKEIIKKENLTVTKKYPHQSIGDSVGSTMNSFYVEEKHLENDEVLEILGTGGFNRTYYVIHNIKDIDYESVLESYDEEALKESDKPWFEIQSMIILNKRVCEYLDPKNILIAEIEKLKKEFVDSVRPIINDYNVKIRTLIDSYRNPNKYGVNDVIKTTNGEFYVINYVSEDFCNHKLTFSHTFPSSYPSFENSKKIKKEDVNLSYFYCNKVNKNGNLAVGGRVVFYFDIVAKVGVIKDFKTPNDRKKLFLKK